MCDSRSCEACWEPLDVGSVAGETQGTLRCVCRASESLYVGDALGRTPSRSHSLHNTAATGGGGSGLTGMDTVLCLYAKRSAATPSGSSVGDTVLTLPVCR